MNASDFVAGRFEEVFTEIGFFAFSCSAWILDTFGGMPSEFRKPDDRVQASQPLYDLLAGVLLAQTPSVEVVTRELPKGNMNAMPFS